MKNPDIRFATPFLTVALTVAGLVGLSRSVVAEPPAAQADTSAPANTAIDPAALDTLKKVQTTMFGLSTYSARCETTLTYPATATRPARERRESATLVAVKPNKMRYAQQGFLQDKTTKQWKPDGDPGITFVSDGKTFWQQFGSMYRKSDHTGPEYMHTILEPWDGFYREGASPYGMTVGYQQNGELLELRPDGSEPVDGVPCSKVFSHIKTSYAGQSQEYWTTWYIGGDGLVRRKVERIEFGNKPGYTRDSVLKDIRINAPAPTDPKVFAYEPPKGVSFEDPSKGQEEPKLLANGTTAPDFAAVDKTGKSASLSSYRGKVVVLDFWASWCPPCRASMPHNQEVAKKLQGEGLPVVLLAVDNSEERDAFDGWVKDNAQLDALTFVYVNPKESDVAGKKYLVSGIPTQYIIDPQGVIRASFVGYGGPTDDLEKAIREALKTKG